MITIDGSQGEGGGQILRTSLAKFRLQHVTAVFTGFGERGRAAEAVACEALDAAKA